jgi:hypothetical protein
MISLEDLLVFVDEALDGMVGVVEELGDELANRRPDVDGTNTPYVILAHCLGVLESWAGPAVAGRDADRHRGAELAASGPVAELVERVGRSRDRLVEELAGLAPSAAPARPPDPGDADTPFGRSRGGALLHLYAELARHLGQMEVTRDVLGAPWARTAPQDVAPPSDPPPTPGAPELLALAVDGRWEEVRAFFDDRMRAAAPVAVLADAWAGVEAAAGAFRAFGPPASSTVDGLRVVDVPMTFELQVLTGRVAFAPDGRVAGLWFLAPGAAA